MLHSASLGLRKSGQTAASAMARPWRHPHALVWAALLFLALFLVPQAPAHAQSTDPSPPSYWCVGGICVGSEVNDVWYHAPCPNGSIASLRACSEASYNSYLLGWWGTLTFTGMTFSNNTINLWWMSQYNGSYTAIIAPNTFTAAPAIDRNLGNKGCQACGAPMAGNPINFSIGNKYQEEDDYTGSGTFPLQFARYYNSDGNGDGTIGARWNHSYSRFLTLSEQQSVVTAMLYRDDGEVRYFNQCGSLWCATADETGTLTATTNSSGYVVAWTYVDERDVTENYDGSGRLLSETAVGGFSHQLSYNAAGQLTSVKDSYGHVLSLTYNSSGQIGQLLEPDGQAVTYAYDASGNLTSAAYPTGAPRTYFYNESAYVVAGDNNDLLTGIQDEAAQRYATYQYDGQSRAVASQHAGGAGATEVAYNSDGSANVSDAWGATRSFTIQSVLSVNHIANVSGGSCASCGLSAAYTYDTSGNLATTTDFNGNKTSYTFDAAHLETQRIDAVGAAQQRTVNTQWNDTLRVPLTRKTLDAGGNVVASEAWAYNAAGQVTAHCLIDPSSANAGYSCGSSGSAPVGVRQWAYTYCASIDPAQCPLTGLLLTASGPRTDLTQTTTYSYYTSSSATNCGTPGAPCFQAGDLYSITDALGHLTSINSYDADGRITRITDPNGVNTDLTYTPRGWLASRSVGGATTSFTYTAYGAVQTSTDPDGVTTTYGYDAAHRLTKVTDALGNYIQYTLDAAGDKTAEQVYDANGNLHKQLTRTYNTLGQLTTVIDGLNQTVFNASNNGSYDANGNLLINSDGRGILRQQGYDALNRLVQTLDNYLGSDPATHNTTTAYQYDSLDRLAQVTDPSSLNTTYSYDGLSDATGQVSPDTGTTSRTFDAAGNVLTSTDAKGVTATNTYDALDRLASTSYSDSTQNVTYSYDDQNGTTGCSGGYPVGRLTRIIENTVTTIYCYDARGNVIEKQQVLNGTTDTTGYGVSAAGRRSSIVYPSGTQVTYARDGDGRIQSISVTPPNGVASAAVSYVAYQPFGPVGAYTLGNGQQITRTFDANYRLTDLTSPAFNLHVVRDAMGDITAIGNTPGANPASETYSYDPLYRLTMITEANGSLLESVTYNPSGDRLTKTGSGLATGAYSYNANTHQLIGTGSAARAVDADGNTTAISEAGSTYGFGYSARNRMTVAQLAGSTIANYTYNALNQRIQKSVGGGAERYGYNEDSQMLDEYGATNRDYVWMDGIPVANVDIIGTTNTLAYVTADQLGTPRVISDANGNAEWHNAYQGNSWNEVAPISSGYIYNLGFSGQYFDSETGLFYNGHRDYDSSTGREIESDLKGLFGGQISTYAYGNNSPLSYVDPSGLQSTVLCANPVNAAACAAAGMSPATGGGVSATAIGGAAAAAAAGSLSSDSKTCPDDDCAALIAKIEAQVKGLETKYNNMLEDEHGLYTKAYDTRMAPPDDVWGTWEGHVTYYEGLQAGLNKMISQAEAKGCPVPADAYDWAQRPAPIQPNNL
ncbi:DUF6531 domain-containing protein [Dyella acidiphila]|uniref:RHS repeat protein n=1 Tax=Dyella acidiphila TaxID=2775866 RepID=A0ABR9GCM4_9GAMM|nr:DUF6531 domain-containing protein [Dyella acidiphila]MBE1161801.1 RHS repeat protein [Dyella acidiphila]